MGALFSVFTTPGKVYASGGVGSGGGGSSGGSGSGNWTQYGWGWAIYQNTNTQTGPGDGFKNGTTWAQVKQACTGSPYVYVFLIDDSAGNAMAYNYTNEDGPPQFQSHFVNGNPVDNGRATAVDSGTAESKFNDISKDPYDVNTAGYTWDTASGNVSWFCFGAVANNPGNPVQPGFTNVSGKVYKSDGSAINKAEIYSCLSSEPAYSPQAGNYITGVATTPDGNGYWLVGADGGVFTFGDAGFYNSFPGMIGQPGWPASNPYGLGQSEEITGIASTPDGKGYYLLGSDGGVFTFGDAVYQGHPSGIWGQAEGISVDNGTGGYTIVGSDGGTFNYGGARSYGNMYTIGQDVGEPHTVGSQPTSPYVTGITYNKSGSGYWLVTNTGAIYTFGSGIGYHNNAAAVGGQFVQDVASTGDGNGYYFVYSDGSIRGNGDAFYFFTNSSGNYEFPITDNANYCVRVVAGASGLGTPTLDSDYICSVDGASYEWQYSNGQQTGHNCSVGNYDLSHDDGLDFEYSSTPIASCVSNIDNEQDTANSPNSHAETVTWNNYVWTDQGYKDGNGNEVYAYNAQPQSTTVNDPFQSMTVYYSYDYNGSNRDGTVGSSNTKPYQFNDGNYYGFSGVTFSGDTTYSSTPAGTQTWTGGPQNGQTQQVNSNGYTGSNDVTFSPRTSISPCVGTVTCLAPNVPAYDNYIGTGRTFYMALEESYAYNSNSSPSIGIYGSGPESVDDQYTIAVSSPNVSPGGGNKISDPNTSLSPSVGPGTISYSPAWNVNYPGDYTITWALSGTAVPTSNPDPCSVTIQIANQPYVQANGGDVIAGSGFENGSTCTQPNSGITAWNNNDGNVNTSYNDGAGGRFGVQAIGPINGFVSAQNSNGNVGPPNGLSFANTTGTFGGSFGEAPCAYNYYSYDSASMPNQAGVSLNSIGASGSYNFTNSKLHGTLGEGEQVTLYVNGNLEIDQNIQYQAPADPSDPTNPNKITSLHVIVNGNINIDPGVTRLDGVFVAMHANYRGDWAPNTPYAINDTVTYNGNFYVAQSNFTSGVSFNPSNWAVSGNSTINTCSGGSVTSCSNQLVVNGAFVADTIKFERTIGTMGTNATIPHEPAEVFNYSPYVWLARPLNGASEKLDAVTSLPPVL